MNVRYHTEDGVLVVTLVGELSKKDLLQIHSETSKHQREGGTQRVLVDARLARSCVSVAERFELTSSLRERFSQNTKHAVVYSPGKHDLSEVTFAQNVAFNRGTSLKMFTDIIEARAWLANTDSYRE